MTVLLGGVATAVGSGSDSYVAPGGSDAAAGTQAAPWRTIRYAIGRLAAGDTLLVRGGSYRESVTGVALRKGTQTGRITVQAFPGERPVLRGLFWLNQADYWTIDGLNVTWDDANAPSQHMVKMIDGVGWIVQNSEIWGARSYAGLLVAGTLPSQPADWVVRGNCIHDTVPSNNTNQDHNVYINTATGTNGLFERNVAFGAPNGMNIKLGPATSAGPGPSGMTVRYNTFVKAAYNVGVHWSARGNLFHHNLMGITNWNYGNFYSYQLTSSDNVARDNAGFGAGTGRLISAADVGYQKVSDGGVNKYPVEPMFDATGTCDGYHPGSAAASDFGAYAGTEPTVTPTPAPTASPTATPTPAPTASPTATPTPAPTASPTATPTATPTPRPRPRRPRIEQRVWPVGPHSGTATAPVRVRWSVTTPLPTDARFELEERVDDGPFAPQSLASAQATSFDGSLALERTYQFRVRSVSGEQVPTAWRYASALRVVQLQESDSRITYTGNWSDRWCKRCSGQSSRKTDQDGASSSLSFSGREVAVIAAMGPRGGLARVAIDGAYVRTIDLYSPTWLPQQVVFRRHWIASAHHTVTVRKPSGSSSRLNLDAVLIAE